ncbi:MAG: VWA domain-containing protein [Candidatus Eremiobacteraeota bacterium]|nr:VWA domain-containing protein [Candidatus Eremiobacteraeota bacterium]
MKLTRGIILCALLAVLVSCTQKAPPAVQQGTSTPMSGSISVVRSPGTAQTPQDQTGAIQKSANQEETPYTGNLANVPRVEVVFVVDTTGSMGGLIAGAKKKIWTIANYILQAEPKPIVRMGLVAYRDNGDQYVTKVFSLTDSMDKTYENLMSFKAEGGGDGPEHVSKALNDAIKEIQWSSGDKVLKMIFLVGDYPPHMDYQDGHNYRKLCTEARQKDIIINTIQCGNIGETTTYWKDIASRGSGQYAAIEQTGGMVTIDTPMDKELADLNAELGTTLIPYGSSERRAGVITRQSKSESLAPSMQAERAEFSAKSSFVDRGDLVDAVKNKEVKLDKMELAELPEELQKLDEKERESYVKEQAEKRDEIKKKIVELSKDREKYMDEQSRKKGGGLSSFDAKVTGFIKVQAEKKGITIK